MAFLYKIDITMDLIKLCKKVRKIVLKASKICVEPFNIEFKGDPSNIVTSADKNIQLFLNKELLKLIPDSNFYQEETSKNTTSNDYLWIIDPIDGTENFSRGIKDFCISVALAINKEVVLGVVYIPKTKELFSAVKGEGSKLNGKPIQTKIREYKNSLFATAFSLYKKEYAEVCENVLNEIYPNVKDFRRFGSCACELCYLAKGDIDLFFEIRVFLWDYAASFLIVKEAGAFISGVNSKEIKLDEITPIIAASSKENFEKLNSIVYKHLGDKKYE